MADFIELHARSAFSFLRGADHPEAIVREAARHKMQAMALTDRDGVYGSARAHFAAKELKKEHGKDFRALIGAEVTLAGEAVVPILVKSRTGYQNLCQLLTRGKLRGLSETEAQENPLLNPRKDGRVTLAEVEEFADGLISLTGDEDGAILKALQRGDTDSAEKSLLQQIHVFGKENVVVEIHRHHLRGEEWINRHLIDLGDTHGLMVICSNRVDSANQQGRFIADAFTSLRNQVNLDTAGKLLARNAETYLKSPTQMTALFADRPEVVENTLRVADRLEFTLENLVYEFPKFAAPAGHDEASFLREEAYRGAINRYGKITPTIRKQLDHELGLISKLEFCGYFLIVQDIVKMAWDRDILVQGRGSAANSAVCYCLGITAVDAIGQKLLFERFLSEGRKTWPDIDLDLPSGNRREAVIQSVFQKYAPRGAAMTANVITYRGRSAMREMGKVLDIPEEILGRFSDTWGSSAINDTDELHQRMLEAGIAEQHPRLPALVHLYQSVYSLPRHLGQHSGGMIITDKQLDTVVPLENATMENRRVVQWDKDDCQDLGIIKVDLLGLGMMAALQDCVELCRERGRPLDLAQIGKEDDPATYDMLCAADTIGVFQVESRAQMATLPRLRPRKFYDLAIEVAIIRPGPIVGGMVHPYLNRRSGKEKIDYIDDAFKPALERTLGVPLFQEQVLQMAMIAADFSGSEAEELRRAISFHRSEERMAKVMSKLRAAMDQKGVPVGTQDQITGSIESFALYGFPESHAISFALLAYASAWMKVHRAAEFYVALLNNQPMGFYSRATLVKDAKAHDIRVRPVDISVSEVHCTIEADQIIRLGLNQVKGLNSQTASRIVAERKTSDFISLEDFLQRTRPSRDARRVLAKIGALNVLDDIKHRRNALWKIEKPLLEPDDLFTWKSRSKSLKTDAADEKSPLPEMIPFERLQADYDGMGLTTGPHPMAYVREYLKRETKMWRASDLALGETEQLVEIGGLVICRQRPGSAKGHVFVSLEDETGVANAFVPAETFAKYRLVITREQFLIIRGRLQIKDNVTSIYALHAEQLPWKNAQFQTQSHDFH